MQRVFHFRDLSRRFRYLNLVKFPRCNSNAHQGITLSLFKYILNLSMPPQDFTINPTLPTLDDKAALLQQTSNRLQQSALIPPASGIPGRRRSAKRGGNYVPAPGTGSRHARDFSVTQDNPIMRLGLHTQDVMENNPPDPFRDVGKRFGFNR